MAIETVLAIANASLETLLLPTITTLFGTNNKSALQIKAFIHKIAMDLKKMVMPSGGFKELCYDYTLATVKDVAVYDLPTNFDRFIDDTLYSKTNYYALSATSAMQWQEYKNAVWGQNTIYKRFRIRSGNKIELDPVPQTTGEILNFTYIGNQLFSNNAQNSFLERPEKDDDLFLLDSQILIRGIIANIKLKDGFDASAEIDDVESLVNALKRDNNPATSFNLFGSHYLKGNVFSRIVGQ